VATVTLRPSANGSLIQLAPTVGLQNYECVDEEVANDATDYVALAGSTVEAQTKYDLYDVPASGIPAGSTINNVTIYTRGRKVQVGTVIGRIARTLKTNATQKVSAFDSLTTSWADYNTVWLTNPVTLAAWTIAEIDALEIGVGLYTAKSDVIESECTQVYVVVDYTPLAGIASKRLLVGVGL